MKQETKVKTDLKITVDQLKNYLGTGLKVVIQDYSEEPYEILRGIHSDEIQTNIDDATIDIVRPICYRLADLDKFIQELGFVPIERIGEMRSQDWKAEKSIKPLEALIKDMVIKRIPFDIVEKLFEWHFWPFGDEFFEQGLVIDKMKQGEEGTNETT